jgi:anion-transporting  ArsA/GET3 family ATPase
VVDPEQALGEWLTLRIGRPAAALLRRSEAFGYLVAAAPGAAALITIGKLVDLARGGDHRPVIVDAPATGHALALLQAPTTYASLRHSGPISADARQLAEFLADGARAAYIGVALPEPMSVTEALELEERLPAAAGRGLDLIIVNGVHPDRFTDAEAEMLAQTARHEGAGVLLPVLAEHRRARRQAQQVAELRRQARAPVITLPFMFPPVEGAELSSALASVLQGS